MSFFEDRPEAARLFEAVRRMIDSLGDNVMHVTKSQIAFSNKHAFAWAWTPDRYLKGKTAPLVLSIALPERDPSERWKEVVEPKPGHWMHHLEIRSEDELDEQVRVWLEASRNLASS